MCRCCRESCNRACKRAVWLQSMSTYSRTPVHRQIWQYSLHCLKPGDTVMGMNLDHGGHLTHGSPVNFSGTYFHIVPYGVNDEGFIDYDKVEEIAMECKPKMIIAGASAYARTIDFKRFREIADECGAVSDGRYGTYRRTCGSRTSSKPDPICRRCYNYNTQDTAWTERRYDSVSNQEVMQTNTSTSTKPYSREFRADR